MNRNIYFKECNDVWYQTINRLEYDNQQTQWIFDSKHWENAIIHNPFGILKLLEFLNYD